MRFTGNNQAAWVLWDSPSKILLENTMVDIPKDVQKTAKNGLERRKKYDRGGTDVGYDTARLLSKGGKISLRKVKHIAKYFPRHADDNLDDPKSAGSIAWDLWGGDAGRRWADSILKKHGNKDD